MKDEEVRLTLEDGPERSFDGATLQIQSDGGKLNKNQHNMNGTMEQDPLLNGNIQPSETPLPKKERPNSLALVPWSGEQAKDYFCFRNGLIANAVDECKKDFIADEEEEVIGSWLLTEISLWDSEKERLVVLTNKNLFTIKYDFIALKQVDHRKVPLEIIDTIIVGELAYPPSSLIPHIDGLATGVSSIVKGCLVRPIQERLAGMPSCTTSGSLRTNTFEARPRNVNGIRVMWGRGLPLSFMKKWNPFEKDIPFTTFTSHPLLWHKDDETKERCIFNVDDFVVQFKKVLEIRIENLEMSMQHRPILLENYIGVGALIHNKHSLGFFKVRGKFSF